MSFQQTRLIGCERAQLPPLGSRTTGLPAESDELAGSLVVPVGFSYLEAQVKIQSCRISGPLPPPPRASCRTPLQKRNCHLGIGGPQPCQTCGQWLQALSPLTPRGDIQEERMHSALGFGPRFGHFEALQTSAGPLTSLQFLFLICHTGIIFLKSL